MATTESILAAATDLGKLIAEHDETKNFQEAVNSLKNDVTAQRAINDLNRHAAMLEQKAATGQPIEIDDKKQIETLRTAVVTHPVLVKFQSAQMNFLDLMRKVDMAIAAQTDGLTDPAAAMMAGSVQGGGEAPPAEPQAGPIITG